MEKTLCTAARRHAAASVAGHDRLNSGHVDDQRMAERRPGDAPARRDADGHVVRLAACVDVDGRCLCTGRRDPRHAVGRRGPDLCHIRRGTGARIGAAAAGHCRRVAAKPDRAHLRPRLCDGGTRAVQRVCQRARPAPDARTRRHGRDPVRLWARGRRARIRRGSVLRHADRVVRRLPASVDHHL
ncbi:hypothetical protein DFQ28_000222 [Apophysomyces sp. BC1034]|nr:hypothetical protein DFQ28_000222 [Apophysomyces sp. BC1034]